MLRTILISAVILGAALGCTTTQHRADAQTAAATHQECDLVTGSHLRPPAGHCDPSPGRTYSADDVRNTGRTDVAEALQMLDPSITVHH